MKEKQLTISGVSALSSMSVADLNKIISGDRDVTKQDCTNLGFALGVKVNVIKKLAQKDGVFVTC